MSDAGFGNNFKSISQRRYLGSKTRLLPFIAEILKVENVIFTSFADIFAGTGVVANFFHQQSNIIVNDILESNYLCYEAFFGSEKIRIPWLDKKINDYNKTNPKNIPSNYFSDNFANTYFDENNSKLIGHFREDIESLYISKAINYRERAYLITSLTYALDCIANTVGHYDAYRKVKIRSKALVLKPLLISHSNFSALIHKQDANELVKKITPDVVYIDPPYNSRQYSDAYHLLENIASWEKKPVYGISKKIDRSHIKSQYSLKSAGNVFSDLINNINSKYILVSYNDMGKKGDPRSQSRLQDHELISALERRGRVTIYEKSFNQFTTGSSKNSSLKERIFFCRIREKNSTSASSTFTSQSANNTNFIKSPLNYTGGKHKLLPQLTLKWPGRIDTFYDFFCGGGNVGINAKAKKVVCIDNNAKLIEVLHLIQKTNHEELHQQILKVIWEYKLSQSNLNGYEHYFSNSSTGLGNYNKTGYIQLRKEYNSCSTSKKPLLLLVLILYGFNNQIRFNSKGEFNLPVGKRDYNGSSKKNLAGFNAATNINDINFVHGDFREIYNMNLKANDFVYLDPPYLLGNATYNELGGWSELDERELYRMLSDLNRKNIRFALSNVAEHKNRVNHILLNWASDHNLVVHNINHHYKNSNYQSTARLHRTREVLITNY